MKAIVYDSYGPPGVLEVRELDPPLAGEGDVLVRVVAASVNPYDWHLMTGLPYVMRLQFGLRSPPVSRLGGDLAGIVQSVGRGVTRFRPGDEVFGAVDGGVPGHPMLDLGTFAELVCVSQEWLAPRPANLTLEQAAAVPLASITALQGLRDYGRVRSGQRVLVNGASGGVGTFAVQIAKSFGAEVTGVCSTANVEMVASIGADHVIDYTREDFTRSDQRFDLVLDNVGNRPLGACRRVLAPGGMYLASFGRPERRWLGPLGKLLRMKIMSRLVSQELVELDQHRNVDDLTFVKRLIEDGEVRPVIDRTYALDEVDEALRYLGEGHARGKVVVEV